jgi:hypothetical protein
MAPISGTSLAIDENSMAPATHEWYNYNYEDITYLEPNTEVKIPDGCYAYKVDWWSGGKTEFVISEIDFFAGFDYLVENCPTTANITLDSKNTPIKIQSIWDEENGITLSVYPDFGEILAELRKTDDGQKIEIWCCHGPEVTSITKLETTSFSLPETVQESIEETNDGSFLWPPEYETRIVKNWQYGTYGYNGYVENGSYDVTLETMLNDAWTMVSGKTAKNTAHTVSIIPIFQGGEVVSFIGDEWYESNFKSFVPGTKI